MSDTKIVIVGSDKRAKEVAEILGKAGHSCVIVEDGNPNFETLEREYNLDFLKSEMPILPKEPRKKQFYGTKKRRRMATQQRRR